MLKTFKTDNILQILFGIHISLPKIAITLKFKTQNAYSLGEIADLARASPKFLKAHEGTEPSIETWV